MRLDCVHSFRVVAICGLQDIIALRVHEGIVGCGKTSTLLQSQQWSRAFIIIFHCRCCLQLRWGRK